MASTIRELITHGPLNLERRLLRFLFTKHQVTNPAAIATKKISANTIVVQIVSSSLRKIQTLAVASSAYLASVSPAAFVTNTAGIVMPSELPVTEIINKSANNFELP